MHQTQEKYSKLIVKAQANASQAKLVDMVTGVRQPPPPHPTQYVVTVVIMWLRHVETIGNSWQHVATVGNTWQQLATFGNTWQQLVTRGNSL